MPRMCWPVIRIVNQLNIAIDESRQTEQTFTTCAGR